MQYVYCICILYVYTKEMHIACTENNKSFDCRKQYIVLLDQRIKISKVTSILPNRRLSLHE